MFREKPPHGDSTSRALQDSMTSDDATVIGNREDLIERTRMPRAEAIGTVTAERPVLPAPAGTATPGPQDLASTMPTLRVDPEELEATEIANVGDLPRATPRATTLVESAPVATPFAAHQVNQFFDPAAAPAPAAPPAQIGPMIAETDPEATEVTTAPPPPPPPIQVDDLTATLPVGTRVTAPAAAAPVAPVSPARAADEQSRPPLATTGRPGSAQSSVTGRSASAARSPSRPAPQAAPAARAPATTPASSARWRTSRSSPGAVTTSANPGLRSASASAPRSAATPATTGRQPAGTRPPSARSTAHAHVHEEGMVCSCQPAPEPEPDLLITLPPTAPAAPPAPPVVVQERRVAMIDRPVYVPDRVPPPVIRPSSSPPRLQPGSSLVAQSIGIREDSLAEGTPPVGPLSIMTAPEAPPRRRSWFRRLFGWLARLGRRKPPEPEPTPAHRVYGFRTYTAVSRQLRNRSRPSTPPGDLPPTS
jgi:hypothetical protein